MKFKFQSIHLFINLKILVQKSCLDQQKFHFLKFWNKQTYSIDIHKPKRWVKFNPQLAPIVLWTTGVSGHHTQLPPPLNCPPPLPVLVPASYEGGALSATTSGLSSSSWQLALGKVLRVVFLWLLRLAEIIVRQLNNVNNAIHIAPTTTPTYCMSPTSLVGSPKIK